MFLPCPFGLPPMLFQRGSMNSALYLYNLVISQGRARMGSLNMPANVENSVVATGLEKVSFHSNPPKNAMPKNVETTAQLYSSHTLAK